MISVIVPVYNVRNYLKRCIDSIQGQTYKDFEILLIDDGSTDGSESICDMYANEYKNIRVIHQKNQGLSAARNTGLNHMQGEYVTFIDSDDFVEVDYLEHLYDILKKNQAQVAVCKHCIVKEGNELEFQDNAIEQINVLTGKDATYKIVKDNCEYMITACGKLFHKSLQSNLYFPVGKLHEDEFVVYKVLYASERVVISNRQLYGYLQRAESITNRSFSVRRLDKLKALKEAIIYFEHSNDVDLKWFAVKRYLLNVQIAWYRVNKFLKKEKQVKEALRSEWKKEYKENKMQITERCGLVDKIAIFMFLLSPHAYSVFADIVKKLFPRI